MQTLAARPRGLTLVEVAVSTFVFSIAVAIALTAGVNMNRAATDGMQYSHISTIGSTVLDRLAEDIADADLNTITMPNPAGSQTVTFQRVTGYNQTTGSLTLSAAITYLWRIDPSELPNGLDDDGNGVIDEGQIVRNENGVDVILSDHIAFNGLTLVLTNGRGVEATVRPYYFATESGARVVRTGEFRTMITARNGVNVGN